MRLISAGTPDLRPMMDECAVRCSALGYTYLPQELVPSSDLQPVAGIPPATFKPMLIEDMSSAFPANEIFGWIDADAIVVNDLSPLAALDFDVAVTMRDPDELGASGNPATDDVNSGVIFFRQTHNARMFLHAWAHMTRSLKADQHALSALLYQRTGIAPHEYASFYGQVVASIFPAKILVLRALEWNCWRFDRPEARQARILHFKSGFRKAFGPDWWQGELARQTA